MGSGALISIIAFSCTCCWIGSRLAFALFISLYSSLTALHGRELRVWWLAGNFMSKFTFTKECLIADPSPVIAHGTTTIASLQV